MKNNAPQQTAILISVVLFTTIFWASPVLANIFLYLDNVNTLSRTVFVGGGGTTTPINDGVEGTVGHTNNGNLHAGTSDLTIDKSVTGVSRPGQEIAFHDRQHEPRKLFHSGVSGTGLINLGEFM